MVIGWKSIASGGGSDRRKSFAHKGVVAMIVVCGLSVGMGCERKPDTLAKAIADARNAMVSASGNGGAALGADGREKTYAKVISSLQTASKDASRPGSAAAAKMLIAQAQAGQGEIAAAQARRLMGDLVLALSDTRAQLELYTSQRALGEAMESKADTGGEALAGELADVEKRLAQKQQDIADAEKRLAEFNERAIQLGTQAQETRRAADEGRIGLAEMNAQTRAARVTEITAQHREADRIEREQANTLLDAEDAQRRLDGLKRQLVALQDQKLVIEDAQTRIADMGELRTTGREETFASASATAAEIEKMVEAFKKRLDEELKPALETAVSKYSSASSGSSQARQEFPGSPLAANYDHTIAGLQIAFSATMDIAASIVQRLADASPELPGAENYRRMVATLENEKKAALEAAGEAYEKASSGFQSARAQGRTAEIFTELGEQLAGHGRRIKGEPEPTPEPAPTEGDEQAPAAPEEAPAEQPVEGAPEESAPADDVEPAPSEPSEEPAPEPTPEPAPEPAPEPTPESR